MTESVSIDRVNHVRAQLNLVGLTVLDVVGKERLGQVARVDAGKYRVDGDERWHVHRGDVDRHRLFGQTGRMFVARFRHLPW